MAKNAYAEELALFKDNEQPEAVLVVAGNAQYVRLVVAWANIETRRKRRLSRRPGGSEAERWRWLWENTQYSREGLIAASAVGEKAFDEKFPALVGNRILYPDGTINSFVRRYLHERVLKLLNAKSPGA